MKTYKVYVHIRSLPIKVSADSTEEAIRVVAHEFMQIPLDELVRAFPEDVVSLEVYEVEEGKEKEVKVTEEDVKKFVEACGSSASGV